MIGKRYGIKISGGGDLPGFLSKLAVTGTKITAISIMDGVAHFRTDKKGVAQIRRHRRRYRLKTNITIISSEENAGGILSSYRFLIACIIPFIASFFLWTVEVESDMPEIVERIEGKLEKSSIIPFKPIAFIPDEGEIRRDLMLDEPALSWVRIRRVGATLTIIPMLSPPSTNTTKVDGPPSDLVARTGGVITRFELEKGERVSRVHQTVKEGDVLATGTLEQGDKTAVVGADGSVYADYWIEYAFNLPKKINFQTQGEEIVAYTFHPPWQRNNEKSKNNNEKEWLPWPLITSERHVKEIAGQFELAEGMEQTTLIPLLKYKLLSETFSKAIIRDEQILHVTYDNDKVSGTILFLINDDIAIKRPIPQGD
ncbi:sporulation protein YqfD [Sporosarcina limicola]|uniref:Stage IV sporulation protein n=1 Tax=Sporosarcina limicola TaxID=34101 RepID=A0A927MFD6_9BACL|nr:sporulation protein YqfD [Sporosarcina limicola]MBE1553714.1 hypothetical protein [Sporosarcina limicola]